MHHPAAVLDRAEPAHLQVLFGGGGPVVGGVVDHDDEEARALAYHLPVDRREAVLVADRGPDRGETRQRDQRHLVPRHTIHRHLVGRRDPAELLAERHVLAEGHELHLHVPVDDPARRVERERHRALRAVGVVGHRARDRGRPDGRDRLAHRRHELRVRGHAGVERPLAPHDQVRGVLRELEVAVDVQTGDRDVFVHADEVLDRGDIHLDRGDVHGATVRSRDGDRRGHNRDGDRAEGQGERPRPPATPPPLRGEQEQPGHDDHREGQGPHPADGREGQRRVRRPGSPPAAPIRTRRAGSSLGSIR